MGLLRWHALCAEIPALEDMQTQNNLQLSSSSSYIAGHSLISAFLLIVLLSLSVFLRRAFGRVYVFLLQCASALMPTSVASLEKSLQQLKPFGPPMGDVESSSGYAKVNRSPRRWEQCLDLKTGEMYYINWENGEKRKGERGAPPIGFRNLDVQLDDEEEDCDSESCYTSEGSSECSFSSSNEGDDELLAEEEGHVLVVGGCKRCLMYFMVAKVENYCPKCNGHLLRF